MKDDELGYSTEYIDSIRPMDLGWTPYHDGVYWQPQDASVVHARRQTNKNFARHQSIGGMTLRQFQEYGQLDWLRPHGEFRTVLHMERHLIGEHSEFAQANDKLRGFINRDRVEKLQDTDTHEVISELGDILWFLNAFATNGAIDIEQVWQYHARNLTEGKVDTSLRGVDAIVERGYVPRMGMFELDDNIAVELLYALGFTSIGTKIIIETHSEGYPLEVQQKQRNVSEWLAIGIGLIAYHAHNIDASFSDVAAENIQKISLRAERKTLDNKQARSQEEL